MYAADLHTGPATCASYLCPPGVLERASVNYRRSVNSRFAASHIIVQYRELTALHISVSTTLSMLSDQPTSMLFVPSCRQCSACKQLAPSIFLYPLPEAFQNLTGFYDPKSFGYWTYGAEQTVPKVPGALLCMSPGQTSFCADATSGQSSRSVCQASER